MAIQANGPGETREICAWGVRVMEELRRPSLQKTVNEILESLPDVLNEMYSLIITRLPVDLEPLRRSTFLFIYGALRPVTVDEVVYANAVHPGREFDPETALIASKNELLKACRSLAEVFKICSRISSGC